jgi:PAS domain S-box-containing protein
MNSLRHMSSEQRLRLFANQATAYGILFLDDTGVIIDWSEGARHLTGWTAEEAIGQPSSLIFTLEDQAAGAPAQELDAARRAGQVPDVRWHLRRDGSRFFVDGVTSALYDEDGRVIGFGKVLIDITQRKCLADSAEWQASLLELSHDAVFTWDFAGDGIQYWNQAAHALYGYAPADAIGHHSHALLHTRFPDGVESVKASLRERGSWEGILAHTRRDGGELLVESRMVLRTDRAGHPIVLEANRDVTEERRAQEQIQRTGQWMALILASSIEGIYGMAPDGVCTFVNPAGAAMLGFSAAELVGRRLHGLIHHHRADGSVYPEQECRIAECIAARRSARIEDEVFWRRDGTPFPVSYSVSPMIVEGQCTGTVITFADISVRSQAETQLRESAERVRLATDAADLGIWTWDAATDSGTWENERLYEMFGISPAEGPINSARFIAEFVHPDDVEPYLAALRRAMETGERFHFEGRFYRASDRALRWLEFTGLLSGDAHGRAQRMIGTATDITARKESDLALRDARIRLQAALNAAEIGTWIYDIRTDRVTADENMAALFGIPDDLVQAGASLAWYTRAIHPDDLQRVDGLIAAAIRDRMPYEATYRVRGADGLYRTAIARGRAEYAPDGTPTLLPGVVLDVTGREQAERELRESEARFRTLITSMDEAFCIIDVLFDDAGRSVDYRFIDTNPAFDEQTGLIGAAGKTAKELVPGLESHWFETYGRVAVSGEAVRIVEESPTMGRWFDVYATRIESPENRRVAVLFKDITAQKRSEETLRQIAADLSETNRRKTEFLAVLAHELRNPLAPIRTGLELMRMDKAAPPSVTRISAMMERQVGHMVHLIDDLLDIARISSGKVELKCTHLLLKSVVAGSVEASLPAIEAKRHALAVDVPDEPLWLDADPTRLTQVLGNLLTNAAKYTPEGGHIALTARRDGDEVVLSVTDDGIGIPPESLPRVFDMFSQVGRNMAHAQGGLGIGLSLVRHLVALHGGTAGVSSAGPGRGSTFTVRLPLARRDAHEKGVRADRAAEAPGPAGLRILVADDNVDAASMLAELLRLSGHEVRVAHDGRAALATAQAFRPELALLDIGMPGMNGYEVAAALRRLDGGARTQLIAVTGWGAQDDRDRASAAGFDHHLTKPVDLAALNRLLAARG